MPKGFWGWVQENVFRFNKNILNIILGMPPEGLPKLNIFKLNGLKDISDDEIGKLFS